MYVAPLSASLAAASLAAAAFAAAAVAAAALVAAAADDGCRRVAAAVAAAVPEPDGFGEMQRRLR